MIYSNSNIKSAHVDRSKAHKPFHAGAQDRKVVYQWRGDREVAHQATDQFRPTALYERLEWLGRMKSRKPSPILRSGLQPRQGYWREGYVLNQRRWVRRHETTPTGDLKMLTMQKLVIKAEDTAKFQSHTHSCGWKRFVKCLDKILHDIPSCPALDIPCKRRTVWKSKFNSTKWPTMIDVITMFLLLTVINEKSVRIRVQCSSGYRPTSPYP